MNKKKILIISIVLGILIAGILVYYLFLGAEDAKQTALKMENWNAPFPTSPELVEQVFTMFDDEDMPTYEEFMSGLSSGKINLIWELWRLRRSCPAEMDRYQCNSRIITYLLEKYPGAGGEKLAGLIRRYLTYEEIMSETRMPDDLTMRQRYDLMREKRKDIFNAAEEALVFGMEEAKMDLADRGAAFVKDTAGMPGDQRVKAYEEMRKKTMGPYYDAFIKDEPSFDRYETEIFLRDSDFSKASSQEQTALTHSIRVRYFGEAGAARMAAAEKELATEEQQEKNYQTAEEKFLKENPSLSEAQREAALKKLRSQYMGEEDSEAYARRQQYEEAMKKMNVSP